MCHPRFAKTATTQMGKFPPQRTQRSLILAMNTKHGSQRPGCNTKQAAGFAETLQGAVIGLKSWAHPLDFLFPLSGARAAGEVWEGGRQLRLEIGFCVQAGSEGKGAGLGAGPSGRRAGGCLM